MALSEEVRKANLALAAKEAAAAPRLPDDAVTRLRILIGPRVVQDAMASRSARSARSARVGET